MKRQLFTLLAGIFIIGLIGSCSPQPYEIDRKNVSEILETLSSDEMRGRQALTPDIDRAADVIIAEFEEIGLGHFGNLASYRQEFAIEEYSITEANAVVNGRVLPTSDHFGFVKDEEISWEPGSVSTASITADDTFPAGFRQLSSSDENLLVFVDEAHEDIFRRYQTYFSQRHSRAMASDSSASVYFVISQPTDNYAITAQTDRNEHVLANVIGKIDGNRQDEVVLFSAHYDHIGIQNAVQGDSIANGANDNASGVTAVIELARHFASKQKPERTLLFVGFTAEEMGGYGSQYFSSQLNPDNIVAMFNIEMIGKPAVSGPNTAWITGYDRSTFGELLSASASETSYEFYPDPYPSQNLFYRSDNATLARLGVPAHTISTTPIDVDPDYHQVSDEYETINISHLTNTIKAIARAAEGIVSGEDTPSRVDPSQVD
jgi:Zn-dependent M28 family amino/carboxypeptidase